MRHRRSTFASIPVLSLVLAVSACVGSDGTPTHGGYAKDGSFTTVINQDPGNLDPMVTDQLSAQLVDSYAYDSLVWFDPKTGKPQPYLADSWTSSPTTLTFKLHKGISCSDGTAFTARTAATDINWVATPKNASPLRDSVVPSGAHATADMSTNTLTVTVGRPQAFLLNNVGSLNMVCAKALADPKSVQAATDGTGLFKLTSAVANDHYTFVRRAGYAWGPNRATSSATLGVPKTVTIRVVKDPSTVTNLLLSGQLNAAMVTGPDVSRVSNLSHMGSPSITAEMLFNQMPGKPTADYAVRRALVEATDLDAYARVATAGRGRRATEMSVHLPPVCPYDSVSGHLPSYNLTDAKRTLDSDGWHVGAGGVREKAGKQLDLNLYYTNDDDASSAAAELLQQYWKALGVNVTLKGGDSNYVVSAIFSSKNPAAWDVSLGIDMQSNTPDAFVSSLSGEGPPRGANFAFVDNPTYTRDVKSAESMPEARSCETFKEAESSLISQLNVVPIAVSDIDTYFNGAASIYPPGGGGLSGVGVRAYKK